VERFILKQNQKYLHRNSWKREDIINFSFHFKKKIEKRKKNISIQDSNKRVKFVTRIREAMCLQD